MSMSTKNQPPLVHHLARVSVPPPYINLGVKVHSFVIDVERDRLQSLCDAWFDTASEGAVHYRALLSSVLLIVVHIDEISPGNPANASEGRTSEIELGLWTLVMSELPFSLVPRWLPLRLLVNSADAVVVGREVYGFPKEFAQCDVPGTVPSAGPFIACGHVTPNPGDVMTWSEVMRVEASNDPPWQPPTVWRTIGEANLAWGRWLASHVELSPFDASTRESLLAGASIELLPFLFLKQVISAGGQDTASYQAVLEANPSLLKFRVGGVNPSRFRARVQSYQSHPFESVLGIASGAWLDVGQGIWADLDFSMNEGQVVFEAS